MARVSIDIDVKGKFGAFKKLQSNVKRMSKTMKNMDSTVKKTTNQIKKNFLSTNKSSNGLANKLGFIAFQWTFVATQARVALETMINGLKSVIREGSEIQSKVIGALKFVPSTAELAAGGFDKMRESMELFNQFGRGQTPFNLGEVADIFGELQKAIDDVDASKAILPFALKIKVLAPDIDAEDLAIKLTNVVTAAGIDPTDEKMLAATFDGITNIMNKSTLNLDSAIKSFALVATNAKLAALTFSEVGAILGIAADSLALTTEQKSGRNLNALIEDLKKATQKGSEFSKQLALNDVSLFDDDGKFIGIANTVRGLTSVFEDEFGSMEEASDQARITFFKNLKFTARSTRLLAAIVAEGADEIENRIKGIKERGTLKTLSEFELAANAELQLKKIDSAILALKFDLVNGLTPALFEISRVFSDFSNGTGVRDFFTEIGQILGEEVVPVIKAAVTLLKKLTSGIGKNERLIRPFIKIILALGAAMAGLFIFASVTAFMAIMGTVLEKMAFSTLIARVGFLRLFAILAVLALAFIGTSIVIQEMKKDFEDMDEVIIRLGAGMSGLGIVLAARVHPILGLIAGAITVIALLFQELENPGSLVKGLKKLLGPEIVDVIEKIWKAYLDFRAAFGRGAELIHTWSGNIKLLIAVIETLKDIFAPITDAIDNFFIYLAELFSGNDIAKDIMAFIIDPIGTLGDLIVDALSKSVNNAIKYLVAIGSVIGGAISIGFKERMEALFDIGGMIVDAIMGAIDAVFNAGASIASALIDGISDNFNLNSIFGNGGGNKGGSSGGNNGGSSGGNITEENNEEGGGFNIGEMLSGLYDFLANTGAPEAFAEVATATNEELLPKVQIEMPEALEAARVSTDKLKVSTDQLKDISNILKISDDKLNVATKILKISDDNLTIETDKISKFYNGVFTETLDFNKQGLDINTFELQLLQIAFQDLRSAVRELEAKIRRTRVKFKKNDDGKIIGFKLIGGISKGEIENLASTAFADGGIVKKPTVGLVGEAGAEAIIPLSKLDNLMNSGAREVKIESNISITVEGNGNIDVDDLVEKVSERFNEDIIRKVTLK